MDHVSIGKIADTELRDYAAHGPADEQRSVIVELGMPPPQMPLRTGRPGREVPHAPAPWPPADLANIEGHADLMDRLEKCLVNLGLQEKPMRLNVAQAFIVSVTPAQLREISRWSLAGAIRPNRRHYASPGPSRY